MKFSAATALALATVASASPLLKRQQDPNATGGAAGAGGDNSTSSSGGSENGTSTNDPTPIPLNLNDTQILQYALTLEHLEAAFYNQSLQQLGEDAFSQAGFNASTRNQLYSIGRDEAAHVDFLTQALGPDAVGACTYNFSAVQDVPSFLATAQVLEGVGVSAYIGAARNITSKDYLVSAASILTVESRHASYINSQVSADGNVVPSPYDTPLDFNQVYSLAAPFITECPRNQSLPFSPFPAASLSPAGGADASSNNGFFTPGSQVTVSYDSGNSTNGGSGAMGNNSSSGMDGQTYLAIIQGPTPPVFLPFTQDQPVTLPSNLTGGQIYAIVTSSNSSVTDDNTIAGPAVAYINVPLPEAPSASASASSSAGSTGAAGAPGASETGSMSMMPTASSAAGSSTQTNGGAAGAGPMATSSGSSGMMPTDAAGSSSAAPSATASGISSELSAAQASASAFTGSVGSASAAPAPTGSA
ncbi:uncharacterized protein PFL1_03361 [Pseudozyma flocculosa PF-1]|uniref:Stress response protein rds1p n=2 Tax=Pseudozyma flocculosa TaxID=84751 RepID=A0A5C3F7N9_9BASI|nr:uncharacterized protein PFL1_03361 [Pseudozyma flocculosa PF-1]EPQ29072.1 hypothetical protein PFL1_03361 [Pseudozyma flocculosa PF-1]SPO40066.1 uncharacterized protein PSFLO_05548 [Pseudozyma flocculosa]